MNKIGCEISVVSPVYNEEEGIEEFYHCISKILESRDISYEIVFVDDGSDDRSYEFLRVIHAKASGRVRVIKLARNFGHQLAITAGIREAKGKAIVVMDSDLQDPPEMILKFIEKWREGYDTVYGVRRERMGETLFKRITAKIFYSLLHWAAQIDIPENVGDFYLIDRKVVDVLNSMQERHRYIRGMVAWVGFRRIGIDYVRSPRFAGRTKFGLLRMVKFSFDAATSFSVAPLRVIAIWGLMISFFAFLGILIIFYMKLFTDSTIHGWSSTMVVVLFIGGIQLLSIGLIGEYVARIGDDVKRRPLYTIQEIL